MGVLVPPALVGALAGRIEPNGTASWSSKLGSGCVRWNVTWLVAASVTIPPFRVQVVGFLRQALAPTMTLYQVPALGLVTLNSRANQSTTSVSVTAWPLENFMALRSVKV